MNRKTFWKSFVSFALCFALVAPFMNVVVNAQEGNAKLIARLQNRSKLQLEGKKFETAVAKLKPLASKTAFTVQDIAIVDAFIKETDDGEQIAVRAQSKAFAAAQDVKAFEDGVKAAVKGKNPQEFIESLEKNPQAVYQINGSRDAANAFTNSVKADAAILKTVGERMKSAGKKPSSQNIGASSQFGLVKASFQPETQPVQNGLFDASFGAMKSGLAVTAQTGVIEAALIALAAAYLGVQVTRLTTGAIGRCIARATNSYNGCIRDERADGGGLTTAERLFCRGEFLLDAYLCIVLPI